MWHVPDGGTMAGWVLLASDRDLARLTFLQGMLEAQGIRTQLLNQLDSMYPSLGCAHLYVPEQERMLAQRLMDANG